VGITVTSVMRLTIVVGSAYDILNRELLLIVMATLNTQLTRITFKEFCKKNGYTTVAPKVRINKSGYAFVTFVNDIVKDSEGKSLSENIYFSKNTSKDVMEGDDVSIVLRGLFLCETINADGEIRMKICGAGEESRLSVTDLFA
jgi:hypothetical protein